MKTAKDCITEIKINDANIDYIRNHPERKINGSLLQSIEKAKAQGEGERKDSEQAFQEKE